MKDLRIFGFVHLLAALSLPIILAICFSGCLESDPFLRVDPGAESDPNVIEAALLESSASQDPAAMKIGQFVHTEEVNDIANGAAKGVISDTGETLIDKQDLTEQILFTVVETRIEYLDHGNYRAASTERKYEYTKPKSVSAHRSSPAAWYAQLWNKMTSIFDLNRVSLSWSTARAEINDEERLGAFRYVWPQKDPRGLIRALFAKSTPPQTAALHAAGAEPEVSFHRFKSSTETIPAPALVQKRANCGGLAGCQIRLHNIEFDQVIRRGEDLERIHFDFATSADVPYFATNFRKCITLMVPISTGTKTVLKQCANVVDFRFESDPN